MWVLNFTRVFAARLHKNLSPQCPLSEAGSTPDEGVPVIPTRASPVRRVDDVYSHENPDTDAS